ncbi:hypothetical protein Tco_0840611 [Tanacetum coccineum]|uniref:Uncharacterized protein n=1 Tax=Tanacetum coccineum TaxID=301880 RepID=A0ABQ5AYF3_9ASTR
MKMEYWIQNADHNLWRIVHAQGNSPKMEFEKIAKDIQLYHPPDSLMSMLLYKGRIMQLRAMVWWEWKKSNEDEETMLKQYQYESFQCMSRPDNDDINLKFLRALPSSWSQVALALKTRGGLESMSFYDLYNKLRSRELDVTEVKTERTKSLSYEEISKLDMSDQSGKKTRLGFSPKGDAMHSPSITGTYMPIPYKSDIEETQISDSETYASSVIQASRPTKDFPPAEFSASVTAGGDSCISFVHAVLDNCFYIVAGLVYIVSAGICDATGSTLIYLQSDQRDRQVKLLIKSYSMTNLAAEKIWFDVRVYEEDEDVICLYCCDSKPGLKYNDNINGLATDQRQSSDDLSVANRMRRRRPQVSDRLATDL